MKKNHGFTPNLDFNPVFTKFNYTGISAYKHTPRRVCSTSRKREL